MNRLLLAVLLLGCTPIASAQPSSEGRLDRGQSHASFCVDFSTRAPADPLRLWGVNLHLSESRTTWDLTLSHLDPSAGAIRIMLPLHNRKLQERYLEYARWAAESGFELLFCIWGSEASSADRSLYGSRPPRSTKAWVDRVEAILRPLLDEGLPLRWIEVWNEPDQKNFWSSDIPTFAQFWAEAVPLVQERFPGIPVGGPGLAGWWSAQYDAEGRAWWEAILDACAEKGTRPDFLSWHLYSGWGATALEEWRLAERLADLATDRGLPHPQTLITEWNAGVPGGLGTKGATNNDNHIGGARAAAVLCGLQQSALARHFFFFVQDAPWGSKKPYDGRNMGWFTRIGGPKPTLLAFQMAAQLPAEGMVPVTRAGAPWNTTMMAARDGDEGWLLLANSPDKPLNRAIHHLVERPASPFVGGLGRREKRRLEPVLAGRQPVSSLNLPAAEASLIEEASLLFRDCQKHAKRPTRLTLSLTDPPRAVTGAWLLDRTHGNPGADPSYLRLHASAADAIREDALEQTAIKLEAEGWPASQIRVLRRAMQSGKLAGKGVSLPLTLRRRAEELFTAYGEELQLSRARELTEAPQAVLPQVDPAQLGVALDDASLVLELEPHSALLLRVTWASEDATAQ